ncbi:type II toxin-antitoxin system VapC family toxin [Arthrobacter sp. Br18]|uniref:PIN domain-containing protein n=1 Tax=Arthrobacter sp. Br18 TaxID=1312954 RepID=UPI000478AD83|nr:type II toxin-antitoxin system VapC family toxin [Arthrobacter sp. Br18]
MIGVDTNVLVRYLVQDDPQQSAAASSLIRSFNPDASGFISLSVLVESFWVLKNAYRLNHRKIAGVFGDLAASEDIVVENPDLVREAARRAAEGYDFADVVIALDGRAHGCEYTATFDSKASQLQGMRLLPTD